MLPFFGVPSGNPAGTGGVPAPRDGLVNITPSVWRFLS
jgi:hypothetical protein